MFESITHQIKKYQNPYETLRARRCDTTSGRLIRLKPSGSTYMCVDGEVSNNEIFSTWYLRVCLKMWYASQMAILIDWIGTIMRNSGWNDVFSPKFSDNAIFEWSLSNAFPANYRTMCLPSLVPETKHNTRNKHYFSAFLLLSSHVQGQEYWVWETQL